MNKLLLPVFLLLLPVLSIAQSLEEGEYYIHINKTGKYLGVDGASALVQWDYVEQDNHRFIIKKSRDGATYTIMAKHSGRYLNPDKAKEGDGIPIVQSDFVDNDNMKWYIIKNDQGGGWYIMNKKAQKRIRLRDGDYRTNNGMPLVISLEAPEQVFSFKKVNHAISTSHLPGNTSVVTRLVADIPDGIYKIKVNRTGKYLAIAGDDDINNGARLIQTDFLQRNNHLFQVKKLPGGNYTITPLHSRKVLDVVDMKTDDGTQIQQWNWIDAANQHWKFHNARGGGMHIVSVASGKKLQLSASPANNANGVPLILNATSSQEFTLEPSREVPYTEIITLSNLRVVYPKGDGDMSIYGGVFVASYDKRQTRRTNFIVGNQLLIEGIGETEAIDMEQKKILDFKQKVTLRIPSDQLDGHYISVNFGINENDADIRGFTGFGVSGNEIPDEKHKGSGNDDFMQLQTGPIGCMPRRFDNGYRVLISIEDIPRSCVVKEILQDEDGSDNILELFYTITREKKY